MPTRHLILAINFQNFPTQLKQDTSNVQLDHTSQTHYAVLNVNVLVTPKHHAEETLLAALAVLSDMTA